MNSIKKVCTKCGEEKELNKYYNKKTGKYGKTATCKKCKKTIDDNYRNKNKIKIKKQVKDYYANNKEKIKKDSREYHHSNKIKIKKRSKIYREKNKKSISLKKIEWKVNKIKNDPAYKLKENISSLFRNTLRNGISKKSKSFFSYTGISIYEYIDQLKKSKYWDQFCNNENIEIEHIIPCSIYDLTNRDHVKKCWNIRNLRLLPRIENIKKGNKIDMSLIKKHNIIDLMPYVS